MKPQRRILLLAAVRHCLTRLNDVLSKGDFERLEKIFPLFENNEKPEASVADCLNRLSKGSNAQDPLSDFRAFRYRLKEAAASIGMGLELSVDSRKRSTPAERLCWFTLPPDPTADRIAKWAEQETVNFDSASSVHSRAAPAGHEVYYVAAYDLQKEERAEDFLLRLEQHVHETQPDNISLIQIKGWKLNAGDKDCDLRRSEEEFLKWLENKAVAFGLVMSSGKFLRGKRGSLPIIVVDLEEKRERTGASFETCVDDAQKEQQLSGVAFQIQNQLEKRGKLPRQAYNRKMQEQGARHLVSAVGTASGARPLVKSWAVQTSFGISAGSPPKGRPRIAVSALQRWVKDREAPPYCALLGEYGIGKTTTLRQFAQWLLSQRGRGENLPLPIFIDLRNYSATIHEGTVPGVEVLLEEMLDQVWKSPDQIMFNAQDILRMVREEGAVLIFDGLDEKLVHLDETQGRVFLRTLWQALPPSYFRSGAVTSGNPGRLVLSCRSHYFKTLREQNAMLRGEDRDQVRDALYRAWFLLPFDELQIEEYLRQVVGSDRVESVMCLFQSVHDLRELAGRPYLLSLMCGYIEELERRRGQGETVRSATLYGLLVNEWLARDGGKHQLRPEDKLHLMEDIAADMWREGYGEWPWKRVLDWLTRRLEERAVWRVRYLYSQRSLELLEEDFRTATFVLRPDDSQDRFRFAHTSLQEYFLARYLYRALVNNEPRRWEMHVPSPETLDFLGQLIESDPENRGRALQIIEELLSQGPPKATDIAFRYWLRAVDEKLPVPAPQNVKMRGADLSGLAIRSQYSDPKFNLCHADLAGANLVGSRFENVDLSHANLSGVRAEGAEFLSVTARCVNIAEADLTATRWRLSDVKGLKGAETAIWYDSNLIACELDANSMPKDFGHSGTLSYPHDPDRLVPDRRSLETSQVTTILGHAYGVNACSITPDGQHAATGSEDNTIRIWDIKSGICLRTLIGHTQRVRTCAISPDSRFLVSGSHDETLRVWDLKSGNCLRTIKEQSLVLTCAVTPDSRCFVSGSMDNALKVWDLRSGACLRTLEGHSSPVQACAIAPDGSLLVSGSSDKLVKIWDLETGNCLRTLEGHSDSVQACAIAPDGSLLVSGSRDKLVKIWDLETGACIRTLDSRAEWIEACAITSDGRHLVSGSSDGTLKVWDLASGGCLRTLEGHGGGVTTCAVTPDGRQLLSGSKNDLLSGPHEDMLKVWDLASGACLRTLRSHTGSVEACAIAPDGHHLISGSFDGTLKVWNLVSGSCLRHVTGHGGEVRVCAIFPDGQHLVSGSSDKTLKVWKWKSGECLQTLEGHRGGVYACAIIPNGQYLVSGSSDRTLKVWNWKSGECLRTLESPADFVGAVVALDSRYLVSGSRDNTLRVWDLNSGTCIRTFRGHTGFINACATTPDGRYLVSGSRDNTLRVWDLNSGICIRTFRGHTGFVNACATTPDGRYLVSGSRDNTLKVWDLNSETCSNTFVGHADSAEACAITPDGRYLVSGSRDNTLKVWNLRTGVCHMTLINGPNAETAALDYRSNRVLFASPGAWRFLGWRYFDQNADRLRILPVEHAGILPVAI